jgi:lipopolysaccharide export system protein LptC
MPSARPHQPEHERMDWLQPGSARDTSPLRTKRYSMFVTGMKVVLPSLAVAILFAVMMSSSGNSPPPRATKSDAMDSTMRDAVFTSRDGENPYKVEAPVARQNPDTPGMIDLTTPKGTIDMGDGTMQGSANAAQYNEKNGELNLQGGVTVQRDDGTTFKTEAAKVDVNAKTMTTDQPVVLQGTFGEVQGSGMEVKEGGKIVTFTGPSKARLNMGSGGLPGASTPASSQPAKKPATLPKTIP